MTSPGVDVTFGSNVRAVHHLLLDTRNSGSHLFNMGYGLQLNDNGNVTVSAYCLGGNTIPVYMYAMVSESPEPISGTEVTDTKSGALPSGTELNIDITSSGKIKSIDSISLSITNNSTRSYHPFLEVYINNPYTIRVRIQQASDATEQYTITVKYKV